MCMVDVVLQWHYCSTGDIATWGIFLKRGRDKRFYPLYLRKLTAYSLEKVLNYFSRDFLVNSLEYFDI